MTAVQISADLRRTLIEHALDDAPNECCGLLELDAESAAVVAATAMENVAASPMRFELHSRDLRERPRIEERGRVPVIYHSHPRSAPEPSLTDVTFAAMWPGVPWLIIGIAEKSPELRWFEIEEGVVRERSIDITDD